MFDNSSRIPDDVRKTVKALAGYDLKLPGVDTAIKELDRIDTLKPPVIDQQTLVDAYADPKATRASLDQLAAAVQTHSLTVEAYGKARINAGRTVATELFNEIDTVVERLRPDAEECIDAINWYIAQGRPDVGDLVRAGRTKDAERAAAVPAALTRYRALMDLRDKVSGRRFNWDAATWRTGEPSDADRQKHANLPVDERWLIWMEHGAEMWWPTFDEAIQMTDTKQARREAEARAAHQARNTQKQRGL